HNNMYDLHIAQDLPIDVQILTTPAQRYEGRTFCGFILYMDISKTVPIIYTYFSCGIYVSISFLYSIINFVSKYLSWITNYTANAHAENKNTNNHICYDAMMFLFFLIDLQASEH
ncbi:hypothetical protein ACJX0J_031834, partial [Zea mays]